MRGQCQPVAVSKSGNVRPVEVTEEGLTVGEICYRVTGSEKAASTVSHHLKELRHAGLITMKRRGKNMICAVDRAAVQALSEYLLADGDGTDAPEEDEAGDTGTAASAPDFEVQH